MSFILFQKANIEFVLITILLQNSIALIKLSGIALLELIELCFATILHDWSLICASQNYPKPPFSFVKVPTIGIGSTTMDFLGCGGDACGAILLFILIVVIVIIYIVASATIPHFRVVATCLLLSAMVLVTLHELLVVESSWLAEKVKTSFTAKN